MKKLNFIQMEICGGSEQSDSWKDGFCDGLTIFSFLFAPAATVTSSLITGSVGISACTSHGFIGNYFN